MFGKWRSIGLSTHLQNLWWQCIWCISWAAWDASYLLLLCASYLRVRGTDVSIEALKSCYQWSVVVVETFLRPLEWASYIDCAQCSELRWQIWIWNLHAYWWGPSLDLSQEEQLSCWAWTTWWHRPWVNTLSRYLLSVCSKEFPPICGHEIWLFYCKWYIIFHYCAHQRPVLFHGDLVVKWCC